MKYDSQPMPPLMIAVSLAIIFLLLFVPIPIMLIGGDPAVVDARLGHVMGPLAVAWFLSFGGVGIEYLYWRHKEKQESSHE
jgi:hypothetical protein